MKAITTKYISATGTRGSRIRASEPDGKCVYVSFDYSKNIDANHDAAAGKLCEKLKWYGTLVRGSLKDGNVYVWWAGTEYSAIAVTEPKDKSDG